MRAYLFTLLFTLTFLATSAQRTKTGPVLDDYGAVFPVPELDVTIGKNEKLKALFEINRQFDDRDKPNPLIESAARYLNLHAQNNIPTSQQAVVLIIHGGGVYDLLNNDAYRKKYGISNPNAELIAELHDLGVRVVVCGQSAANRNLTKAVALPEVEFALSAMTALVKFQNDQYRLIKF
ncbi:DsrE family protein [Robertkochia aurantiaca]|uniref:DsrE family protein n=1 Tax=Robertkochia aurantiaca TaxID=2873700 RepID=UPI001CCD9645|nr:DsrE family protein [Robertkochia sp. 3YJGBD-33]